MKNLGSKLVSTLFFVVLGIVLLPLLIASLIDASGGSFFFSIICALFLIAGAWQLFRGKIGRGILLLALSTVVYLLVLYNY